MRKNAVTASPLSRTDEFLKGSCIAGEVSRKLTSSSIYKPADGVHQINFTPGEVAEILGGTIHWACGAAGLIINAILAILTVGIFLIVRAIVRSGGVDSRAVTWYYNLFIAKAKSMGKLALKTGESPAPPSVADYPKAPGTWSGIGGNSGGAQNPYQQTFGGVPQTSPQFGASQLPSQSQSPVGAPQMSQIQIPQPPPGIGGYLHSQLLAADIIEIVSVSPVNGKLIISEGIYNYEVSAGDLNNYPNITSAGIRGRIEPMIDLSTSFHINTIHSTNTELVGGVKFGPGVVSASFRNFTTKGALDFSACANLANVSFSECCIDCDDQSRASGIGGIIFPSGPSRIDVIVCGHWLITAELNHVIDICSRATNVVLGKTRATSGYIEDDEVRRCLSTQTAITLSSYIDSTNCRFEFYDQCGQKNDLTTSLRAINEFPNIKRFNVSAVGARIIYRDLDLSCLGHIETFECNDCLIAGKLTLGQSVKVASFVASASAAPIDCSRCTNISEIVITSCEVLCVDQQMYTLAGVTLPDAAQIKVWLRGRWNFEQLYRHCAEMFKSNPNVTLHDDTGFALPKATTHVTFTPVVACASGCESCIQCWLHNGSNFTEIGRVQFRNPEYLIAALNGNSNIKSLTINSLIANTASFMLDLSHLNYIEDVIIGSSHISDGEIKLGKKVKTIVQHSSCISRGINCSECENLESATFCGCRENAPGNDNFIAISAFHESFLRRQEGTNPKTVLMKFTGTWPRRSLLNKASSHWSAGSETYIKVDTSKATVASGGGAAFGIDKNALLKEAEILEIKTMAELDGIGEKGLKDKYKKLAFKFHPDRDGNTDKANERFQNLQDVYEKIRKYRGFA
ncbi:MAG: J domain-containing protein [Puniceicoccales bacterium]|jgi:hypothetical protein|nr:J domain-containing protein [Puniceicoccales bacterium]